jgi:hypothetical protein
VPQASTDDAEHKWDTETPRDQEKGPASHAIETGPNNRPERKHELHEIDVRDAQNKSKPNHRWLSTIGIAFQV